MSEPYVPFKVLELSEQDKEAIRTSIFHQKRGRDKFIDKQLAYAFMLPESYVDVEQLVTTGYRDSNVIEGTFIVVEEPLALQIVTRCWQCKRAEQGKEGAVHCGRCSCCS